jgi:hypothetical protein
MLKLTDLTACFIVRKDQFGSELCQFSPGSSTSTVRLFYKTEQTQCVQCACSASKCLGKTEGVNPCAHASMLWSRDFSLASLSCSF